MKMSTRTRYGVRMLIDLARNYNKGPFQINAISKLEEISEKYLGQITIILKSSGIINSVKGASGGFFLTRDPAEINLKDVVRILEGDINIVECINNKDSCNRSTKCVTKNIWKEVNEAIESTLEKYTLKDLVDMSANSDSDMFYI